MPYRLFVLLKSYLAERSFLFKNIWVYNNIWLVFWQIRETPRDSVGICLNTADLPTTRNTKAATFTDDTTILEVHACFRTASSKLLPRVNGVDFKQQKQQNIKTNVTKSIPVTFSIKAQDWSPCFGRPHIAGGKRAEQKEDSPDRNILYGNKTLELYLQKLYWTNGGKSQVTLEKPSTNPFIRTSLNLFVLRQTIRGLQPGISATLPK